MILQNTTYIPCGYVEPNLPSSTQLGCGTYSLNKRSNVPFVALVGSMGFRKVISWGEIAAVPKGELVTVHNASYHGGDIWLNKGADICNRPSRISVPVQFELTTVVTGEGTQPLWRTLYPCDTRSAKRAYLNVDAYVNPGESGGPLTAFIRGRRLDGSMNTANSISNFVPPFGPGVGYLSALQYPINTELGYIPLGQGAAIGDDTRPHNMLDASDVFFLFDIGATLAQSMIWPASRQTFGFPVQQAAAPGSWYIVEYD